MEEKTISATARMLAFLRSIKVEMNGAVVDSMRERGLNYALSYGVSLPTIQSYAKKYAYDSAFAKTLYAQQIRELRLAACYIVNPVEVTFSDEAFWASGLETTEIADVLAMRVLSKSPESKKFIDNWLDSSEAIKSYAALMTALRTLNLEDADFDNFMRKINLLDQATDISSFEKIAINKIKEKAEMLKA